MEGLRGTRTKAAKIRTKDQEKLEDFGESRTKPAEIIRTKTAKNRTQDQDKLEDLGTAGPRQRR